MSGHSKWATIRRKKEKIDAARGKIFTKLGRELMVAVREGGGPNPDANMRLKECINKAKAANMPNDNIKRLIERPPVPPTARAMRRSAMRATAPAASP